jgi:competence protein ComEC
MLDRIRASPSLRFAAACLAFLAGVASHAAWEHPSLPPMPAGTPWTCVAAAFACMAVGRSRTATVMAFALLAVAGFVRYEPFTHQRGLIAETLPTRAYEGIVVRSPKRTPYGTRLTVDVGGKFLISTRETMEVRLGDVVAWSCAAQTVAPEPGPGYDDYLRVRGIAYRCTSHVAPVVVGHRPPPVSARSIDALRGAVRDRAQALYPEPESSMLMGLLVGETDGLAADLTEAFRQTGTSHILAVSGYNITQLVELVSVLLAYAGLARRRAAVATAGVVAAFTLLAGAEASVVRAACMGCAGLAARLYRRRYVGTIALLAAAAVMVAANPLVLAHDAGFQLSFLAVTGLQWFGKPFERFFGWIPEAGGVRRMAAETSAATVATLPLTLYAFGMFPPTAFVVNLLVLPFIPVVMLAGASSLLAGPAPALAVSVIIQAQLAVIRAAAAWQPAFDARIAAWGLAAGYGLVAGAAFLLRRPRPAHLRKAPRTV